MKKNIIKSAIASLIVVFIFTSCVEQRYYKKHNRHSREYYDNRHQEVPIGVELRIHN